MTKIKELARFEKPREKAQHFGLKVLSNAELIAILLRTGTKKHSAIEVANTLLRQCDGLKGLSTTPVEKMKEIPGISDVKALELKTIFEVMRRVLAENCMDKDVFSSPDDIADWLKLEIGFSDREYFLVLYLNQSNQLIGYDNLFSGTINETKIYQREIIHQAIVRGCTKIILAHNHPSGNLAASDADIMTTVQLMQACQLMNVDVLDHLIVTQNGYTSFVQEGIMSECRNAIAKKMIE